jgi:hypothetical protein
MKRLFLFLPAFAFFSFLLFSFSPESWKAVLKNSTHLEQIPMLKAGDIVFQSSLSGQSHAIQLATKSRYSHCGILLEKNGNLQVFEAVQPVKFTPFEQWIRQGENQHYVVKRLKDPSVLTDEVITSMSKEAKKLEGKNYDIYFGWSDETIYCSELVWKLYKRTTALEIGELKPLGSYDLSDPIVKRIMHQRYGKNVPLKEQMISPGAIFDSELLENVAVNRKLGS